MSIFFFGDDWKQKYPGTVKLAERELSEAAPSKNAELRAVQKAAWGKLGNEPPGLAGPLDCPFRPAGVEGCNAPGPVSLLLLTKIL